jgi:hypothetical protein
MTVMAFLYGRSSLASISTLNGTNRVVDRQERVRLLRLYGVDCIRLLREWGESLSKDARCNGWFAWSFEQVLTESRKRDLYFLVRSRISDVVRISTPRAN